MLFNRLHSELLPGTYPGKNNLSPGVQTVFNVLQDWDLQEIVPLLQPKPSSERVGKTKVPEFPCQRKPFSFIKPDIALLPSGLMIE
jgi:hypothetical protein